MTVKLVKRGDLSLHDRDAVVLATSETYDDAFIKAMDDRYGRDENGGSLILGWIAHLNGRADWVPGMIMRQMLGPKADQAVIFVCVADRDLKASYPYVRDVMQKLVKKKKTLEIETAAMMFLGGTNPSVNKIALEPVIAAAVGEELHVDLYEEFSLNVGAK